MSDEPQIKLSDDDNFPGLDEEMRKELIDTFILEFEELMELYKKALIELRRLRSDKVQALEDIFRVYHTLKGDAAYFDEFNEFVEFAKVFTERLRHPNQSMLEDEKLINEIRLNYSRLSGAFNALNTGKSLRSFRFKIFLRNF